MKIGILADTHIRHGRSLPSFIWNSFADVEMILHAGDILIESVLEELLLLAPVVAVKGNGDWGLTDLPDKTIISAKNIKIGITHGYLGRGKNTQERAYNTFWGDHVNVIVFGHSHVPFKSVYNGITLFNPGSPTDRRGQPNYSVGILTVEDDSYNIQHLFYNAEGRLL